MNLAQPLTLASKSPRRRELLKAAGFTFTVKSKETDESFPAYLDAEKVAKYVADKKAQAFLKEIDNEILIAADTVVIQNQTVMGKPKSIAEATQMLNMLSGTSHKVITGVCLLSKNKQISFDDTTEVHFKTLTQAEILYYINNFNPFDKAGAYGIQEWIGMVAIEKIVGSYFNVMGLPVHKIYDQLKQFQC